MKLLSRSVIMLITACVLAGCATRHMQSSNRVDVLTAAQKRAPLPCINGVSQQVPLIRLLANPQEMNGKCVTTVGVLAVVREGTAIYLDRASYRLKIPENRVGLLPKGGAGYTWARFAGTYVTVTGIFDGTAYGGWPSGLLKNVLPLAVADWIIPPFAAVHASVHLTESQAAHFSEVLKAFARWRGFSFYENTPQHHGRTVKNIILMKKGVYIGAVNFDGPNIYRIDISNPIPWISWENVKANLTAFLRSHFGKDLTIAWTSSHKQ